MNVVVLVKQIPDSSTEVEPADGTTWLTRVEDPILDDTDRYGVELGLQLADGGTVTLLSLGVVGKDTGLREALAMGADEAILIEGDADGASALTTARALAAQIGSLEYDIVVTGTASTDGSSGLLPQMLGELLDAPTITNATHVVAENGGLTVHRQSVTGHEVVSSGLPAVVSVTAGAVEPRYPSFKGTMAAKRKQIARVPLGQLVADRAADTTQRIVAVQPVPTREAGVKIQDDGEAFLAIVELLGEKGII